MAEVEAEGVYFEVMGVQVEVEGKAMWKPSYSIIFCLFSVHVFHSLNYYHS